VIERCFKLETDANAEGALPWVKLASPALVDMWMQHALAGAGERSIATGKATCVIDVPALDAAAWYFMVGGREDMRVNLANGDPARIILSRQSQHDFTFAAVKRMPFPLHTREFVGRQICFTDATGSLVVAFEPPPEAIVVDYGRRMNVVRGRTTGFMRFSPIADGTQCNLELYQQLDAGGRVPVFVVSSKTGQALSPVAEMREHFQRDDEVDAAERGRLAATIRDEPEVYEEGEEAFIVGVQDKLGGLKEEGFKELESPDKLVKMHSIVVEGSSTLVLRASTVCCRASASEASV
jgi:hypothetical protein